MRRRKSLGCFKDYELLTAKGKGTGRYENYRPALTVREVPSKACKFRIYSPRFKRTFHFFSAGEYLAFLQFEWQDHVFEIREQYPLNPAVTTALCEEYGIKHPGFSNGRGGIVMTTDFFLSLRRQGGLIEYKAVQIKDTSREVAKPRTNEKLFIEKTYWERQGIKWHLYVSDNFNKQLCRNLETFQIYRCINISCDTLKAAALHVRSLPAMPPDTPITSLKDMLCLHTAELGILNGIEIIKLLTAQKLFSYSKIAVKPFNEAVTGDFTGGISCS